MMETILTALFAVGLLVLKDRLKRFAFHKSAHKQHKKTGTEHSVPVFYSESSLQIPIILDTDYLCLSPQ